MANQQIDNIEDINEAINPITPPINGQEGLEMLGHNRNQPVILSRFSRSFFKVYSHLISLYLSIKNLGQNKLDKGGYDGTALELKNWLVTNYTTLMNNIRDTLTNSINTKLPHGGYNQSAQTLKNEIDTKLNRSGEPVIKVNSTGPNTGIINVNGENMIRSGGSSGNSIVIGNYAENINLRTLNTFEIDINGIKYLVYHEGYKPQKSDVGLSDVDNTPDSTKSVRTAARLTTPRKVGGVLFDGSNDITLPGVNSVGNQNTTGNAATADKLKVAKTINGVPFDGSKNIEITANPNTHKHQETIKNIGNISSDSGINLFSKIDEVGNYTATLTSSVVSAVNIIPNLPEVLKGHRINTLAYKGGLNPATIILTRADGGGVFIGTTSHDGVFTGWQQIETSTSSLITNHGGSNNFYSFKNVNGITTLKARTPRISASTVHRLTFPFLFKEIKNIQLTASVGDKSELSVASIGAFTTSYCDVVNGDPDTAFEVFVTIEGVV